MTNSFYFISSRIKSLFCNKKQIFNGPERLKCNIYKSLGLNANHSDLVAISE